MYIPVFRGRYIIYSSLNQSFLWIQDQSHLVFTYKWSLFFEFITSVSRKSLFPESNTSVTVTEP